MAISRTMTNCMNALLQRGVIKLALLYKVVRGDGTVFGFTTHDRRLRVDGVVYEALAAVDPTNIRQESGGDVDSTDFVGALTSNCITEEDLVAGRYDDASVTVYMYSWGDPAAGTVTMFRGSVSDVTLETGTWTAAVRSTMQRYRQQIGELYSPTCRVFQLGDARCKVNLAGHTVDGSPITSVVTVLSLDSQLALHFSGGVNSNGFYSYGTLTAMSGKNRGVVREVKLHSDSDTIDQASAVSAPASASDLAYRKPTNYSASQSFTFAIPAGRWDSATMLLSTLWALVDADSGTDNLNMQAPTGQANDVLVQSVSLPGPYDVALQLGLVTVEAINAAAGSDFAVSLRHSAPSEGGAPYFHVDVDSLSLVLTGVAAGTSDRLVLHEAFPFDVVPGDQFRAVAGCDRLPGTCSSKFNNIANFRGEPTVPGIDKLLQTGRSP